MSVCLSKHNSLRKMHCTVSSLKVFPMYRRRSLLFLPLLAMYNASCAPFCISCLTPSHKKEQQSFLSFFFFSPFFSSCEFWLPDRNQDQETWEMKRNVKVTAHWSILWRGGHPVGCLQVKSMINGGSSHKTHTYREKKTQQQQQIESSINQRMFQKLSFILSWTRSWNWELKIAPENGTLAILTTQRMRPLWEWEALYTVFGLSIGIGLRLLSWSRQVLVRLCVDHYQSAAWVCGCMRMCMMERVCLCVHCTGGCAPAAAPLFLAPLLFFLPSFPEGVDSKQG